MTIVAHLVSQVCDLRQQTERMCSKPHVRCSIHTQLSSNTIGMLSWGSGAQILFQIIRPFHLRTVSHAHSLPIPTQASAARARFYTTACISAKTPYHTTQLHCCLSQQAFSPHSLCLATKTCPAQPRAALPVLPAVKCTRCYAAAHTWQKKYTLRYLQTS